MALDPRFVLLAPLQEQLVDKTTGLPLSGGIVYFYEDENPNVLKPVYQLSGAGPYSDASYVELNNPIQLTSIGTFADNNGNDIVPYLFPYDGTPTDSQGTVELYYIVVTDANGGAQFTRHAWPNVVGNSSANQILSNYIPNGQFLLHNSGGSQVTVTSSTARAGEAANCNITYIAQGGWTFEVPSTATSTNTITFITNGSASSDPDITANPRYSVNVTASTVSLEAYKDLCIEFPNVNKFSSSSTGNIEYTFGFQAFSTGAPVNVSLLIGYNYGTGTNSPSDYVESSSPITTWTIESATSTSVYSSSTFQFSTNAGEVIGNNNDDFVKLILRFPSTAGSSCNVTLTDFILTPGDVVIQNFPVTPDADFLQSSTAGWLPSPKADGSDLYLPVRYTPQGMQFDTSVIGKIYAATSATLPVGELACNGTGYITSAYSSDGIPYSRLQAVLYNSSSNIPIYGTGPNFITQYPFTGSGLSAYAQIATNINGTQPDTADGNPGFQTNFTFTQIIISTNNFTTGLQGKRIGSHSLIGFSTTSGAFFSTPADGLGSYATGFTITTLRSTAAVQGMFQVQTVAASGLTHPGDYGKYFQFSNTTTKYYIWFFFTNEMDPSGAGGGDAATGTGIKITANASFSADDIADIVTEAISGNMISQIEFNAASTLTSGQYFAVYSNGNPNYIWYSIGGTGSQPGASIYNNIEVSLTGTETAAQVQTATLKAINQFGFAVPDLRGMFLRGITGASVYDNLASSVRWSNATNLYGNALGTYEFDGILSHLHGTADGSLFLTNGAGSQGSANNVSSTIADTSNTGINESRPVNAYVNWVIKY